MNELDDPRKYVNRSKWRKRSLVEEELKNRFKSLKCMSKEQTEREDLFSGKNRSYLSEKGGK